MRGRIVVLTGAGMSAESGVGTFRHLQMGASEGVATLMKELLEQS